MREPIERERAERELEKGADEDLDIVAEYTKRQRKYSAKLIPTAFIRTCIDFSLPILVGAAAFLVLLRLL